jgi:glycosyltransferase involved in cell wall biosynthesis
MKRVLYVAYEFPPLVNGGGVLRAAALARHLPAFGWQPCVLAAAGRGYYDGRRLQAPPVEVVRVPGVDLRFTRVPAWFVPDPHWPWLLPAVVAGWRLLRQRRFDLIYTTSSPWTASLVGLALQRLSRLPWISEQRDPWPHAHGRWLSEKFECWVAEGAHRLVVTTESQRAARLQRFPRLERTRVRVVPNGFDAEDLPPAAVARPPDRFTMVYAGGIDAHGEPRNPGPLLEQLSLLCKASLIDRARWRLKFIGVQPYDRPRLREQTVRLGLNDVVEMLDDMPREQTLAELRAADALLLLQQGATYEQCLPAKTFEYLYLQKPILCLAPPDSEAGRFVAAFSEGSHVVPHQDGERMREALLAIDRGWTDGTLRARTNEDFYRRFERQRLVGALAALMDELV